MRQACSVLMGQMIVAPAATAQSKAAGHKPERMSALVAESLIEAGLVP
jgi:hypothetical protein